MRSGNILTNALVSGRDFVVVMASFIIVGSMTNPSKAIPIETSNSPIFKQDFTASGGLDYNFNQPGLINRLFDYSQDKLFFDDSRVIPSPQGLLYYQGSSADNLAGKIARRGSSNPTFRAIDTEGKIVDVTTTEDNIIRDEIGRPVNVVSTDPSKLTVVGQSTDVVKRCSSGQLVGDNCQSKTKVDSLTGFVQGAVKTGSNTAVLAGYDSFGSTAYGAGAIKLDNLALTAGADRQGLIYSAAYSVGNFSPFYARQRGLDNYGIEYRASDNFAFSGALRGDNSFVGGIRVDLGSGKGKEAATSARVAESVAKN